MKTPSFFPIGKTPLVYIESDETGIGVGVVQCRRCGTILARGVTVNAEGAFDVDLIRFITHAEGRCQEARKLN